ncbi:MAG: MBL fold metallo-hydrolase [Verrucomicrobiota bacterium]
MDIIFLGTGTSQGVPMIAHSNEGCDLTNPKNWRTRSAIHIVMDGWHVQVDAGPEFRLQCLRCDITQIDTFILTHGHADHLMGMDDLRRFCDMRDFSGIEVYGEPEGLRRVREVYPYAIGDKPEIKGYPAFMLREMPPQLDLPGGTVYGLSLPHGRFETLGLVFVEKSSGRKCVYYNDCKEITAEGYRLAEGADVVILDGLRPHEHSSHMTIEQAIAAAQKIGAPQSYLTHMTFQIDHDTWSAKLPEGVELAYDGLTLQL